MNVRRMLQRSITGMERTVCGRDKGIVKHKSLTCVFVLLFLFFFFKAVWDMITLLLCRSVTNLKVFKNKLFSAGVFRQHFQSLDKLKLKLVWPGRMSRVECGLLSEKNLAVICSSPRYYKVIVKKEAWKPPLLKQYNQNIWFCTVEIRLFWCKMHSLDICRPSIYLCSDSAVFWSTLRSCSSNSSFIGLISKSNEQRSKKEIPF